MTELDDREAAVPAAPLTDAPAQLADGADDLVEAVIAALRTVHDPEIPVNIYDLGLIYRITPDYRGAVEIDMTLTAPGCPVAGEMMNWVRPPWAMSPASTSVKVNLVFDPPWDKSKMSEDVQLELGLL